MGAAANLARLPDRLLPLLASPTHAVLLLLAGLLLLYLECNRPGSVFPGALGILLSLLGIFGLSHLQLRSLGLLLLLAAGTAILIEIRLPSSLLLAPAGIVALTLGLATLTEPPLPLSVAILSGIGFGTLSFALARIARRARTNKRSLSTGTNSVQEPD